MVKKKLLEDLMPLIRHYVEEKQNIVTSVETEKYLEFSSSRGIVDVHESGMCRYFANEEDFNTLKESSAIVANNAGEAVAFVIIELS